MLLLLLLPPNYSDDDDDVDDDEVITEAFSIRVLCLQQQQTNSGNYISADCHRLSCRVILLYAGLFTYFRI